MHNTCINYIFASTTTTNVVKYMNKLIFNKLKDKIELDSDNEIEVIGCSAKHNNYEISFYGESLDNYTLIVEDFGKKFKGDWFQDEPTAEQLETMQKIINSKVTEVLNTIKEEKRNEETESFFDDPHEYYGVPKTTFY